VFAGQHSGSTGTADGITAEAVFEDSTFGCNSVDGWGNVMATDKVLKSRWITAQGLQCMVIRKDKQDVGGATLVGICI